MLVLRDPYPRNCGDFLMRTTWVHSCGLSEAQHNDDICGVLRYELPLSEIERLFM